MTRQTTYCFLEPSARRPIEERGIENPDGIWLDLGIRSMSGIQCLVGKTPETEMSIDGL